MTLVTVGVGDLRVSNDPDSVLVTYGLGSCIALCVADSEKMSAPVRVTADYAYFRLRDEGYTPDDISRWAETIARETAMEKIR